MMPTSFFFSAMKLEARFPPGPNERLIRHSGLPGTLSYAGDGKMRTYSLSKRYESQIALITKAVEIGLNEMSRQAKDQKKGQ